MTEDTAYPVQFCLRLGDPWAVYYSMLYRMGVSIDL